MQSDAVFSLWPRLHGELLGWLDRLAEPALAERPAGLEADLATQLRHIAAAEEHWVRVILEREDSWRDIPPGECPDLPALRRRLEAAFAATEELLGGSRPDALVERPVRSAFPVRNALEALALSYTHFLHHRAQVAVGLRALGIDPGDWL